MLTVFALSIIQSSCDFFKAKADANRRDVLVYRQYLLADSNKYVADNDAVRAEARKLSKSN